MVITSKMRKNMQQEDNDKNNFFSILNKAISSPVSFQTSVKSDENNEKQTRSHKTVNASEKLSDKSHE